MKTKTRPFTPFRPRLWWAYGLLALVLWLSLLTLTFGYTEMYYQTPTPYPSVTPSLTPAPAASGGVDAAPARPPL